jgi:DNA polymerase V
MSKKSFYKISRRNSYSLPLLLQRIPAGFPSQAESEIERTIDLNEQLIKHPAATFFVRVEGDSMINVGIQSGDILIVDRAVQPTNNCIIIAHLNGELTVKRIAKIGEDVFLLPENKKFRPIHVMPEMNFEIWGVVTYVIHQVK